MKEKVFKKQVEWDRHFLTAMSHFFTIILYSIIMLFLDKATLNSKYIFIVGFGLFLIALISLFRMMHSLNNAICIRKVRYVEVRE